MHKNAAGTNDSALLDAGTTAIGGPGDATQLAICTWWCIILILSLIISLIRSLIPILVPILILMEVEKASGNASCRDASNHQGPSGGQHVEYGMVPPWEELGHAHVVDHKELGNLVIGSRNVLGAFPPQHNAESEEG
jgi:hypothetical protein